MPVYFDSAERKWKLDNVTKEETEELVKIGKSYAMMLLGFQIVAQMKEAFEQDEALEDLDEMDVEDMGQA